VLFRSPRISGIGAAVVAAAEPQEEGEERGRKEQ
jgi:hypothetical protein